MKIRLLALLCVLAMLLCCFVSCKEDDKNPVDETTPNEETEGGTEVETEYIEAVKYDKEFIILSATVSEAGGRHFAEFGGDYESTSIAYEIYNRDAYLEEKYDIIMTINSTVNWNTEMQNAHMSDDLLFHIATPGASNAVYSITNGFVADLNEYPHFDFSKPWWQTDAINQMSVIGKNMMAIGDINLLAYDSVGVIFFSKKLAEDKGIKDLYDQVNNGTWTYEKMLTYVADVTADTSGNGTFGVGDTFGLTGGSYSALCFTYGGNYSFVAKDADDAPILKSDLSDFINFFQKVVADHAMDYLIGYDNVVDDPNIFKENRQLFAINMLGYSLDFRNLGIEYGILPLPKWDEKQTDYWTFPHQSASTTICIPTANKEYEMTSRIVEDMAYLSRRDVLGRYVEENLYYRSLNGDENSYNTVLKLLQHLNCDIFFSYRAGITEMLRSCMNAHNTNIASQFEKYTPTYQKQLNAIVGGLLK